MYDKLAYLSKDCHLSTANYASNIMHAHVMFDFFCSEKQMLERELLVSKKILNRLSLPPPDPGVCMSYSSSTSSFYNNYTVATGDNKETWKYVAAETKTHAKNRIIHTGMAGVSEFEKKVQAMATVIEEHADELVG